MGTEKENVKQNKHRAITRVLLLEGCVNTLLCLLKVFVGVITNSAVVLSDALHSLTDLINNIIAYIAIRTSSKPPDKTHPYGHQKFEYIAIFVLATLLTVVSVELILYAIENHGQVVEQSQTGIGLLIFAIVVNLALSIWEGRKAKQLKSKLLEADAKHTFSDVLTSIAVLVGWQLAAMGYYWLDTLFCFLVSLFVGRLAWQLFQQSIPVLVDADVTATIIDRSHLEIIVRDLKGIQGVRSIRSRAMGEQILADLTILVDPTLSITQAHDLAHEFEDQLKSSFDLYDVVIHIEPGKAGSVRS